MREGLVAELSRLMAEASAALTLLDADRLDELGRRAGRLAAVSLQASAADDPSELPLLRERFDLFSSVLRATSENLDTLRRADGREILGQEIFGQERFGLRTGAGMEGYAEAQKGLFESMGLYDDAEGGSSIWPRAGRKRAGATHQEAGQA